jgi:hypothetical protein
MKYRIYKNGNGMHRVEYTDESGDVYWIAVSGSRDGVPQEFPSYDHAFTAIEADAEDRRIHERAEQWEKVGEMELG